MNQTKESGDAWKLDYNKTFNLTDWLDMPPPPHMSESDWTYAVMELHTLLTDTDLGKEKPDEIISGWKSKNGLL